MPFSHRGMFDANPGLCVDAKKNSETGEPIGSLILQLERMSIRVRRPSFEHIAPESGHTAVSGLIGRLERKVHVPVGPQEKWYFCQGSADRQMFEVNLHTGPRDLARQRQRYV